MNVRGRTNMRNEEDIKQAILIINNNKELTYGYREDVTAILEWVLGRNETFDGLQD